MALKTIAHAVTNVVEPLIKETWLLRFEGSILLSFETQSKEEQRS